MSSSNNNNKMDDYLIQYIVLRKDLNWPTGALIAQSCHASSAALHIFATDHLTQLYLNDLDNMHKCILGINSLDELKTLNTTLINNQINFKLWTEQPENTPTCLATKPYYKKEIETFFKAFKLFK